MKTFEISVERFNEFAESYETRFMKKKITSYNDSLDYFCTLIKNDEPDLLDLGCGPGNVTSYLKEKFPQSKILGVDLAPKMIELAGKNVPDAEFKVMDIKRIGELNKEYDGIMCSFCFPFLSREDANQFIADLSKRTKTGGALYISTMEGTENKAGFEKTSFSGSAEVYFNYFEENWLIKRLQENSFEIVKMKKQDYLEQDGRITIDLIFIVIKK